MFVFNNPKDAIISPNKGGDMTAPTLPQEILSYLSDLTDDLNLGFDVTDILGDAIGLGIVEAR